MVIRPFHKEDIRPLQDIIRATGVFKEEEVEVAVELMEIVPEEKDLTDYVLFTAVDDSNIVRGYYCVGPTAMTEGTFDLYWIAVDPTYHSKGIGKQLLRHCEEYVKAHNGRLIVAETSSQAKYDNTRKFYQRCNYIEASRIKDYYSVGDDLVVYTKHL
ncbi:MAG: GNAT family N-acetyltransferase [Ignavibacteriales bacterium]|nr:GNAT family N-acetyltransferase [Ignavibacteriales bacterium]